MRLRLNENPDRIYISPFGSWIDYSQFNKIMSRISGRQFESDRTGYRSEEDENCLEFLFTLSDPDPNSPLVHDVEVSIRTTEEDKYISKPVFGAKYDPNVLGTYASSSDQITLEDIGISSDINYTSLIEDIAPDKVKVEVNAIALDQPDLILITNQYTDLVKVRV
jgi:hypothetical protein